MAASLFLLGYPRSGTTLLRAVLGAHSQIWFVNEPELIFALRVAGFTVQDRLTLTPELIERLKAVGACRRHLEANASALDSVVAKATGPLSFREGYEHLLARPDDVSLCGDKSLNNVFFVDDIRAMYDSPSIMSIVRDPRAALLSYYRKKYRCEGAIAANSHVIRFFLYRSLQWSAWRQILHAVGEGVFELTYERLVREPCQSIGAACEFIGLPYEEEMLSHTRRESDAVLASDCAYAHQRLSGSIDSARADAGMELPSWASGIVQRYCGAEMLTAGYPMQDDYVPFGIRVKIRALLALYEGRYELEVEKHMANRFWHRRRIAAS